MAHKYAFGSPGKVHYLKDINITINFSFYMMQYTHTALDLSK